MRIKPLEPPYTPDVDTVLTSMMPPGVPPIALFRTFAHNPNMGRAMLGWGTYELGKQLSVDRRVREIVIDRTCARCGCEYEWGVHVAFFAERVGLSISLFLANVEQGDLAARFNNAFRRSEAQSRCAASYDGLGIRKLHTVFLESLMMTRPARCLWPWPRRHRCRATRRPVSDPAPGARKSTSS